MHSSLRRLSSLTQDPLILRLLKNLNQLDPVRIEELYQNPCRDEASFDELVIRSGLADDRQIARAYAEHYLMPLFDPPDDASSLIHASVASLLPASYCVEHTIAPLSDDGQTLELAIFAPEALTLADEIKAKTGRQMRAMFAPRSVIQRLLCDLFGECEGTAVESFVDDEDQVSWQAIDEPGQAIEDFDGSVRTSDNEPQASNYIMFLLEEALRANASDIHLEPLANSCRARLRVMGRLTDTVPPPFQLLPAVMGEIKRLGKIDSGENHLPQDGSIGVRQGDRHVDVRVSTCPTCFGEKVALRLYNNQPLPFELDAIGLNLSQRTDLTQALGQKQGLILVSGPAKSGKGTTLYACLNHFDANERSVYTIEDRIKTQIDGVCQLQTRPSEGLCRPTALRAVLRQDPDVVMVSQVSDVETAEQCLRGALSDQMVLSTITASDAINGIKRLRILGIDPVLLADTLCLIVSQRLLRRLCEGCRSPQQIDAEAAKRLRIAPGSKVFRPQGCDRCQQSGYDGKVAVFETIPVRGTLRERIRLGRSSREIRAEAKSLGLELLCDGIRGKVVAGQTSVSEALRLHSP